MSDDRDRRNSILPGIIAELLVFGAGGLLLAAGLVVFGALGVLRMFGVETGPLMGGLFVLILAVMAWRHFSD